MATGISLSKTSNLTNGQRIVIASAKEAFEPLAPDPDLIESERIPTGVKQWDISTYARLTDAQALTEGVDLTSVQQACYKYAPVDSAEHGILVTLSNRLVRRQGDSSVVSVAVGRLDRRYDGAWLKTLSHFMMAFQSQSLVQVAQWILHISEERSLSINR